MRGSPTSSPSPSRTACARSSRTEWSSASGAPPTSRQYRRSASSDMELLDTSQGLRVVGGSAPPGADDLGQRLEQLNAIGASLSAERDIHRLLETILTAAKTITRADGGTLYRLSDDNKTLRFEIVRTSSLKYYLGGTTGNPVPFYPIQLHKDGKPNHGMVAAYSA